MDDLPVLALRARACLERFNEACSLLGEADLSIKRKMYPSNLNDEFGRFRLWCANSAAHRKGRSSLDFKLREASHIADRVIELLKSLETVIEETIELITGKRVPWEDASDSGSDSSDDLPPLGNNDEDVPSTELQQLVSSTAEIVTCLMRLSMAIRNPAPHNQFKESQNIDTTHFEVFDIEHVRGKFPEADDFIVERLGKAISRRRMYLRYRESHRKKLEMGLAPLPNESAPAVAEDVKVVFIPPSEKIQSTVASSLPAAVKASSSTVDLDENDYYEETLSQTSYASSVTDNTKLRPPSLPAEGQDGDPFECPLCFRFTSVRQVSAWHKHVYRDLQPYVCTFMDCKVPDATYESRHDWFNHELHLHRKRWECMEGCNRPFASLSDFQAHLLHHHPDSYNEDRIEDVVRTCERTASIDVEVDCSLCKQHLSLTHLRRHMGKHLEELALFAIPSYMKGDDDEDEDHNDPDEKESRSLRSTASRGRSVSPDQALSFGSADKEGIYQDNDETQRLVQEEQLDWSYVTIIDNILAASDLNTISVKRVRKELQEQLGYDISDQKDAITKLTMSRFDKLNSERTGATDQMPLQDNHLETTQQLDDESVAEQLPETKLADSTVVSSPESRPLEKNYEVTVSGLFEGVPCLATLSCSVDRIRFSLSGDRSQYILFDEIERCCYSLPDHFSIAATFARQTVAGKDIEIFFLGTEAGKCMMEVRDIIGSRRTDIPMQEFPSVDSDGEITRNRAVPGNRIEIIAKGTEITNGLKSLVWLSMFRNPHPGGIIIQCYERFQPWALPFVRMNSCQQSGPNRLAIDDMVYGLVEVIFIGNRANTSMQYFSRTIQRGIKSAREGGFIETGSLITSRKNYYVTFPGVWESQALNSQAVLECFETCFQLQPRIREQAGSCWELPYRDLRVCERSGSRKIRVTGTALCQFLFQDDDTSRRVDSEMEFFGDTPEEDVNGLMKLLSGRIPHATEPLGLADIRPRQLSCGCSLSFSGPTAKEMFMQHLLEDSCVQPSDRPTYVCFTDSCTAAFSTARDLATHILHTHGNLYDYSDDFDSGKDPKKQPMSTDNTIFDKLGSFPARIDITTEHKGRVVIGVVKCYRDYIWIADMRDNSHLRMFYTAMDNSEALHNGVHLTGEVTDEERNFFPTLSSLRIECTGSQPLAEAKELIKLVQLGTDRAQQRRERSQEESRAGSSSIPEEPSSLSPQSPPVSGQKDIPEQLAKLIKTRRPGADDREQSDSFRNATDHPPMSKQSLSELDIASIIANPKLRGDFKPREYDEENANQNVFSQDEPTDVTAASPKFGDLTGSGVPLREDKIKLALPSRAIEHPTKTYDVEVTIWRDEQASIATSAQSMQLSCGQWAIHLDCLGAPRVDFSFSNIRDFRIALSSPSTFTFKHLLTVPQEKTSTIMILFDDNTSEAEFLNLGTYILDNTTRRSSLPATEYPGTGAVEDAAAESTSDATAESASDAKSSESEEVVWQAESDGGEVVWQAESDGGEEPEAVRGLNVCVFCGQDEENDPSPEFEEYLACQICGDNTHQQCARDANTLSPDSNPTQWQCPMCIQNGVGDDEEDSPELPQAEEHTESSSRNHTSDYYPVKISSSDPALQASLSNALKVENVGKSDHKVVGDQSDADTDHPKRPIPDRTRVTVYERRNVDWLLLGTGFCWVTLLQEEPMILVSSEDDPSRRLLECKIDRNYNYQKQQDTIVVWTDPDRTDTALTFQEPEGCARIWELVENVVLRLQAQDMISDTLVKSMERQGVETSGTSPDALVQASAPEDSAERYEVSVVAFVTGTTITYEGFLDLTSRESCLTFYSKVSPDPRRIYYADMDACGVSNGTLGFGIDVTGKFQGFLSGALVADGLQISVRGPHKVRDGEKIHEHISKELAARTHRVLSQLASEASRGKLNKPNASDDARDSTAEDHERRSSNQDDMQKVAPRAPEHTDSADPTDHVTSGIDSSGLDLKLLTASVSSSKAEFYPLACDYLDIGSCHYVKRHTDLVSYSPLKCLLAYYIIIDSVICKMEYPFSYIRSIKLERGDLFIELSQSPHFYILSRTTGFVKCGDFTEDRQASSELVHRLGGDPKILSTQLAQLVSFETFQNRLPDGRGKEMSQDEVWREKVFASLQIAKTRFEEFG